MKSEILLGGELVESMREAKKTFEISQAMWKITVKCHDLICDRAPAQVLNALRIIVVTRLFFVS